MDISTGAMGTHIAICPACGYPRLGAGLCAACVPTAAATPFGPTIGSLAGIPDQTPAA